MNVEMQMKNEGNQISNIKEAQKLKASGDEELKTNCFLCKFKPNYDNAIPYYKRAAEIYHAASSFLDEIYCREKLIQCFKYTKTYWEEGKENERISLVHLGLKRYPEAIQSMTKAYQCYFIQPDYNDAVECMKTLAAKFIETNNIDNAEKCLEFCYKAFLQVFHTLATKSEEPTGFLYEGLDQYIAVLFRNDKIRIAIDCLQNVIKVIEAYEEDRTKVIHVFGLLVFSYMVNEDESNIISSIESAKKHCKKNSDYTFLDNIYSLWEDIKRAEADSFKYNMNEFKHYFPHDVIKKIYNVFESYAKKFQEEKSKSPSVADVINNFDKFTSQKPSSENVTIKGDDLIVLVDDKVNEQDNNDKDIDIDRNRHEYI
jgi:hypothetical protein